jgi:hypothetical protein
MDVIRKVAKVPVDMSDRPKIPVNVVNSGEVNDPRNFLNVCHIGVGKMMFCVVRPIQEANLR